MNCTGCAKPIHNRPGRKTTLCRSCFNLSMNSDPAKREKMRDSMRRRLRDPKIRAEQIKRLVDGTRAALQRPEERERRRLAGLQLVGHHAPAGSLTRKRQGWSNSERRLGWCPMEYRALYKKLRADPDIRAAKAREMVEDLIARDTARYHQTGQLQASVERPAA